MSAPSSSSSLPAGGQLSGAGASSTSNGSVAPRKATIKINPRAAARLWKCGELSCENFDMTSKPREETGRKFISDFFGRNKSETTSIPDDVWAFVCRKDYQRSKYASEKSPHAYMTFWTSALKTQLIRLRLWRPEATFEVKLLNRAEERLNIYNAELVKNGRNIAAAKQLVLVVPSTGKKGIIQPINADAIDPVQAQHIKTHFSGTRSIDYILNTIYPWIEQSLRSGALTRMPPIEFLVQAAVAGDIINNTTDNYQMWQDFLAPKWSKADHDAATALMSLNKQPTQPMILTWEAYNAAVASDAAKRLAAQPTPPVHIADAESQHEHEDGPVTPVYKGKGKRRMIEEDEKPQEPGSVFNGRNSMGETVELITPAPPKKRTRSSSQ